MQSISFYTAQGKRPYQEDRYLIEKINAETANGTGLLLAIMDGHCGDAVSTKLSQNVMPFFSDALIETEGRIFSAFDIIVKELQALTVDSVMGSTLSMVYIPYTTDIDNSYAYTCVVGDSPIIILGKDQKHCFSEEHNASVNFNDVDLILKRNTKLTQHGELQITQGFLYFNGRYLQLTRAFGDKDFNNIILREPTNQKIELDSNSMIIVASDGILFNRDREALYAEVIEKAERGEDAEDLVKWALDNHSSDNVTAIVYNHKLHYQANNSSLSE